MQPRTSPASVKLKVMLSSKTLDHLGHLSRLYTDSPQRVLRLLVGNMKLLMKKNRRTITKIELSRLEKINIGTNEIERIAKKIDRKGEKRTRNEKYIKMLACCINR